MGALILRRVNGGTVLVDNQLGNLFADGTVGDVAAYAFVELVNTHASMTVSAMKLFVAVTDVGGGAYAVAVADGVARAGSYGYTPPAGSGLTYTTATTAAAGLALPTLTAGQKCLICVRRDLTAAAQAWPETNGIGVGYTAPVGYT